jgi:uncharacterized protein (UPF0305 family)
MIHENYILIIEATIIIVETIVLIFLIYHFRELRKRTILAHEEITTMKEAISDMHTFIQELHEGTTIAHEQIDTMKKILSEMHKFFKEKQKK